MENKRTAKSGVDFIFKHLSKSNYITVEAIREFLTDGDVMDTYRKCQHCQVRGFCSKEDCSTYNSLNSEQQLILNTVKSFDRDLVAPILAISKEQREDLLRRLDYPLHYSDYV